MKVAYAGMTHLGLNSAAAAAERGFATVGWDPDAALVARLARRELPVLEPGLDELIARNGQRLSFSADPARIAACELVYIAADVPTDDTGVSDLSGIERLIGLVAPQLKPDAVLAILSQVPPGFTRDHAGLAPNLYYQVETLVFGRAVDRALNPERFIVGCADPAVTLAPPLAQFLAAFGCPILPMRYESAELAKISINCCLVASIATANMLAELCEGIGADWSEIAPALKLDRRIGAHSYLAPGLGIAGGNLERDLATVTRLASRVRSDAGVAHAWLANSRHRRDWAARLLEARLPEGRIAVLGLAYKEDTHSTKNSPALALIARLKGRDISAYDPVVKQAPGVSHAADALGAVQDADAVAIMTPWQEFRRLDPCTLKRAMRGKLVLDPYRVLDGRAVQAAGLDYFTLGAPPLCSS